MMIVAFTFVLCLSIILGAYWAFVVRPEERATRKLRRRLTTPGADRSAARTDLTKKEAPLSAVKIIDAALTRSGHLLDPLKQTVGASGLPLTVGIVVLACAFVWSVVLVTLQIVTKSIWVSAVIALLPGALPYALVFLAAQKRLRKLEEQLPQAVDMIATSLRAGHTFTTGLLMVAEEIEEPLGAEFRLLYDQQTYGKPLPDVLRGLAERVPLLDARIFVTAVLTQRETGGNLAEVLDKLSGVIRDRFRIRRQVRALSAHGRITGWTLTLLPPVLAGVLFVIAPTHIKMLITDPLGRQLAAGAVALQLVGMVAVRKIVRVEF